MHTTQKSSFVDRVRSAQTSTSLTIRPRGEIPPLVDLEMFGVLETGEGIICPRWSDGEVPWARRASKASVQEERKEKSRGGVGGEVGPSHLVERPLPYRSLPAAGLDAW